MTKKLRQFVVLMPLAPDQGPLIMPAPAPTEEHPNPAPVLVDERIFQSPESESILIKMGAIALYEPTKEEVATNGTDNE